MTSNILVVEDSETRNEIFRRILGDSNSVHIATTAQRAIDLIECNWPYDEIYLDHDLEPSHYGYALFGTRGMTEQQIQADMRIISNLSGTGKDVAKWIVATEKDCRNTKIVIHSLNSVGARQIWDIFRDVRIAAQVCPFPLLVQNWRVV